MEIIDLHFLGHEHTIAAFLVESTEGLLLFETGPYSTFPTLKSQLRQLGHSIDDIKHVFLTHIHLDHAGAAWALAERGAQIYVHPFGYSHMKDPSKLLASATRIYGDDMNRLWGTLKPIDASQLNEVAHESEYEIGGKRIKAWHTPGHAVHHIAWQVEEGLIAGDVAGVRIHGGPVVPPCPPPDIQLEDWQESIQLIRQINPAALYLTHFGRVEKKDIDTHLNRLEEKLTDWANWMKPHYEAGHQPAELVADFQEYVRQQLLSEGLPEAEIKYYESANPSDMSVAGLMRYWRKKESA
jgi:glyoxylase-like metal-dependent hydrolase (beta-lactamase superfamily II)